MHGLCTTVIGKEEQEGIFPYSFFLKSLNHIAHTGIKMHQHGHQDIPVRVSRIEFLYVLCRSLLGKVNGIVRQLQEKRFYFMPFDKINGLFGESCCEIPRIADHLVIPVHRFLGI
jgi:hypothetical protein